MKERKEIFEKKGNHLEGEEAEDIELARRDFSFLPWMSFFECERSNLRDPTALEGVVEYLERKRREADSVRVSFLGLSGSAARSMPPSGDSGSGLSSHSGEWRWRMKRARFSRSVCREERSSGCAKAREPMLLATATATAA